MNRIILGTVALSSLLAAVPTLAADWMASPGIRTSYPTNWEHSDANPLKYEAGLRYWYSLGEQWAELAGDTYSTEDTTHILEAHFRIDDLSTSTFVKGQAAYGAVTSGDYVTDGQSVATFEGGQIGAVGADFGWTPFGNENATIGFLAGYQYHKESPDRNRLDIEHIDGLNIQELRLGVTGRADFGMFDINAELVAIPYAFAHGATAERPFADTLMQGVNVNRSSLIATGALYGASGQLMLGYHPSDNLTFRVGGRAWLLTGPSSLQAKYWDAATPESYLYSDTPLSGFSLLRYGALAELTGRF
nr:hypothetical protein [uncultured Devosia sp.]